MGEIEAVSPKERQTTTTTSRRRNSKGRLKQMLDNNHERRSTTTRTNASGTIATEPLSPEDSNKSASSKSLRDNLGGADELKAATAVFMSCSSTGDDSSSHSSGSRRSLHLRDNDYYDDYEEYNHRGGKDVPICGVVRRHSLPRPKRLSGWELREQARAGGKHGQQQQRERRSRRLINTADKDCELPPAFKKCVTSSKVDKVQVKKGSTAKPKPTRSFTKKRQNGVLAPHEVSGVAHITDGIQQDENNNGGNDRQSYDKIVDKVPFEKVEFEDRDICDLSCSTLTPSIGSIERKIGRSNTGDFEFDLEDLGAPSRWESKSPTPSVKEDRTPRPCRNPSSSEIPDKLPIDCEVAKPTSSDRVPAWQLRVQSQKKQDKPIVPVRRTTLHDDEKKNDSPLLDQKPAAPKRRVTLHVNDEEANGSPASAKKSECKDRIPHTPNRRTSRYPYPVDDTFELSFVSNITIDTDIESVQHSPRKTTTFETLTPKPADALPPAFAGFGTPSPKRNRPEIVNKYQKRRSLSCPQMPRRKGSVNSLRPGRNASEDNNNKDNNVDSTPTSDRSPFKVPAWEMREQIKGRDQPLKTPIRRPCYAGEQHQQQRDLPSMFRPALS